MSLNTSELNEELKCYTKIIDCYLNSKNDIIKREDCKNQSIIKLMEILKRKKDKHLISNSLILVLSLFNNEDIAPDLFSNLGHEIATLNNSEKKEFISELKKELDI